MTKAELIGRLAEAAEITRRQATDCLDELRAAAVEELRNGEPFVLPGIARFTIGHRQARTGRNVQTGEAIQIPARDVVRCKPSKPFQSDCCD